MIGEVRESRPRLVTREELLEFATRYDPQYFHAEPGAARESIFGDIVASGIHGAALWRSLDHEINGDIRWICGIAWEEVRWPEPVRPGDRIRARSEVLGKRLSARDAGRGIVECRYSLLNQHGRTAFTCRSINLIEVRGRQARGGAGGSTRPPDENAA